MNKLSKWCYNTKTNKTPNSATVEEWSAINKEQRKKPLCWFLTRTVPTWYRVKLMRLSDFKYWFKYRLQNEHKYHIVRTGLSPDYYEIDKRMLHANFNLLKDFVEDELSSMARWNYEGENLSDLEIAMKHLDWECSLTYKDQTVPDGLKETDYTPQALAAQEQRALYIWWTTERPNRKDPMDSITDKITIDRNASIMEIMAERTDEDKEASRKEYLEIERIEEAYRNEDTAMLVRLINIRASLWS